MLKMKRTLLFIGNVVFGTGVFPEILKNSTNTFEYTRKGTETLNKNRPMSLISTIRKLIENV